MSKQQAEFSQVFIVGVGRSGTTLLRAILDNHSQICVTPEAHFMLPLLLYGHNYGSGQSFDRQRFQSDLLAAGSFAHWHMSEAELAEATRLSTNASRALADLHAYYAKREHKIIAIDKTPTITTQLDQIKHFYPNARFIHMVRNGVDVAMSQYQAGWQPTLQRSAFFWARRISKARAQGKKMGRDYLELKYEHLIASPEESIKEVCGWLGYRYEPSILKGLATKSKSILKTVYEPKLHQNLGKALKAPPPKGTKLQRQQVERLICTELKQFGYQTNCRTSPHVFGRIVYGFRGLVHKLRKASWSYRLPHNY